MSQSKEKVEYRASSPNGVIILPSAYNRWSQEQQHQKDRSLIETISAYAGKLILVTNPGTVRLNQTRPRNNGRHYGIYDDIARRINNSVKGRNTKIGLSVHYNKYTEMERESDWRAAIKAGLEADLKDPDKEAGDRIAERLEAAGITVFNHNARGRKYPHEHVLDLSGVKQAIDTTVKVVPIVAGHSISAETITHIAVVDHRASNHLIAPAIGHEVGPGTVLEVTGLNAETGHFTMEQLSL